MLLLALLDKFASSYGAKDLELSDVTLTRDQSKYKHLVGLVRTTGTTQQTRNHIGQLFRQRQHNFGQF